MHTYTYAYTHVRMYTYKRIICLYVYARVHVCVLTNTRTYTCKHIYIHTYIYGTDLMQRRTRTGVMVRHSNVPHTRAREILVCNTLELLASINHRVYTGTFFISEL